MLDGADEGDINTLAITKYFIYEIVMENILFLEALINKLNYGVMMTACSIIQELVILLQFKK